MAGPDAFDMLEYLGHQQLQELRAVNKAKQFVPVTPDGYVIGDVILFYLAENSSTWSAARRRSNWVEFHAQTRRLERDVERDERTALRTDGKRKNYRFQIQGPNAMKILEKAIGQQPPDLKFFNMARLDIAGKDVLALRHGMAGQPGYELFGPWEDYEAVHAALVEAGKDFGLTLVGGRAYSSNTLESGWLPSPLPAIYTGDELQGVPRLGAGQRLRRHVLDRRQLRPRQHRGLLPDAVGHRLRPHRQVRPRLRRPRGAREDGREGQHRQKVTLALDNEDVLTGVCRLVPAEARRPRQVLRVPERGLLRCTRSTRSSRDGKTVGVSTWIGYSSNEGRMLTLAMIDPEYAEPGKEVTLVWGEQNGGTSKPTVEPHDADRDQRDRQPGAVRRGRPQRLRARRLAHRRDRLTHR